MEVGQQVVAVEAVTVVGYRDVAYRDKIVRAVETLSGFRPIRNVKYAPSVLNLGLPVSTLSSTWQLSQLVYATEWHTWQEIRAVNRMHLDIVLPCRHRLVTCPQRGDCTPS